MGERGGGGLVNDLECGRDRSVILNINWTPQICLTHFDADCWVDLH